MKPIHLCTPLREEDMRALQAGDRLLISGTIYTARDSAHKRIIDLLDRGEQPPFDLNGAAIYYAGPAPAPPGKPIGSIGPTTSYRMDAYAPRLMHEGLRMMIGKGSRSAPVRQAIEECGAVYCAAWGGAGALLASRVKRARCIAFEDLGPEAVYELEVEAFPVLVVNDTHGGDAYEQAGGQ